MTDGTRRHPLIEARWEPDFTCTICGESGPGGALIIASEVAMCFECSVRIWNPAMEEACVLGREMDGDEGSDPRRAASLDRYRSEGRLELIVDRLVARGIAPPSDFTT